MSAEAVMSSEVGPVSVSGDVVVVASGEVVTA
jgi:hypothetical protein